MHSFVLIMNGCPGYTQIELDPMNIKKSETEFYQGPHNVIRLTHDPQNSGQLVSGSCTRH